MKVEVIGDVIVDVSDVLVTTFIFRVKQSMKFSFIALQNHREKSNFRQYAILNIIALPIFILLLGKSQLSCESYVYWTVHHLDS